MGVHKALGLASTVLVPMYRDIVGSVMVLVRMLVHMLVRRGIVMVQMLLVHMLMHMLVSMRRSIVMMRMMSRLLKSDFCFPAIAIAVVAAVACILSKLRVIIGRRARDGFRAPRPLLLHRQPCGLSQRAVAFVAKVQHQVRHKANDRDFDDGDDEGHKRVARAFQAAEKPHVPPVSCLVFVFFLGLG